MAHGYPKEKDNSVVPRKRWKAHMSMILNKGANIAEMCHTFVSPFDSLIFFPHFCSPIRSVLLLD